MRSATCRPAPSWPTSRSRPSHRPSGKLTKLTRAAGLPHELPVPISVLSDTYKATHFTQYPSCLKMVAYGEFRAGYDKDRADLRVVNFGMRYIVEKYLHRRWTLEDIQKADDFYATHCAGGRPLPWPRHLFTKFVQERDGYFPIKLQALRDGTCSHVHVPVYQITTEREYAPLCTFLESVLTQVWYPTTVATLSRRVKDVVEDAFEQAADDGAASALVTSRLHDFGMRGCTCMEQSVIGGCAHLLNFEGTDTMSAAYYAQYHLNGGKPVAFSIPATEHSVMTSWPSERSAILNMIEHFGGGVFAIVMDSYDYTRALEEVLPSVRSEKVGKGGYMTLRPDSGDPVEVVLQALHAAEKVFGSTTNSKGFRVISGCGVIQGDGISAVTLKAICEATKAAGFSPENVAYGMGAGLLQKLNRDTLSFATKLSHIVYADGTQRDVMKHPKTDSTKLSLPGVLGVKRVDGVPTVFPAEMVAPEEDLLEVVYDCGPVPCDWELFDGLRERVKREWSALPKQFDPISQPLRDKMRRVLEADKQSHRS